jgi:beta-N-acetylhexosaminidase
MKAVGFNVNFAPSVDVNVNPASPVIGAIGRSFSGDTSIVTRHARIIIDEQSKNKIISVLKHFPGHGSAGADSHLGFVDVSQTWQSYELAPYRALIQSGKVEMIMTAHIFNSQWDAQYPATLSRYVITEMLRNQLGFKGVVISDDMNMKAISEYYSFEKAIEMAVNAGVDILLIANNINYDQQAASKTLNVLKQLVQEGKISPERIEESYKRIMALKKQQLAS